MLTSTQRRLKKHQLLCLLDELATASESGVSIYLPATSTLPEIEKALGIVLKQEPALPNIAAEISKSKTGAVIFWGEQHKYLVLPPFPNTENLILQGYDAEPLRSLLNQDRTIALVVVRLGAYAIGIFDNHKLLDSKVGTGLVHARHKKGGSSQHRYERHRDKQIEMFFTRICAHVQEKLQPYLPQIDYLYYGGEGFTIRSFREQCHYLKKLDSRTMESLLNVREPKQSSLEAAIEDVWSSKVIQWQEN